MNEVDVAAIPGDLNHEAIRLAEAGDDGWLSPADGSVDEEMTYGFYID